MALVHLAAGYARASGRKISAFTVDHGLRAESADEAAKAAHWCAALDVPHKTLKWTGPKPASGVQEAARAARYRLLCDAALEAGAGAILTAHTGDDQAETVFMRLMRGSGPQGLLAMAPVTTIANGAGAPVKLLRPLLKVRRGAVVAFLKSRGQAFVSDPSNDDPAFERVNVRALLGALEEQGILTQRALITTAHHMRAVSAQRVTLRNDHFNHGGGVFHRWGGASLKRSVCAAPHADILLQQLIYAVSGSDRPPALEGVSDALVRLVDGAAASLGGALMELHGERLWIYREPAALTGRAGVAPAPPLVAPAGSAVLWDRRFIVNNWTARALTVAPLIADAEIPPFDGPGRAIAGCPGVFDADALLAHAAGGFAPDIRINALSSERFFEAVHRF